MIGRIRGKLVEKKAPEILVETGGIGYEIQVPMSTVYQLPEVGQDVSLHTHFVVREDAQLLYGFYHNSEKTLFRTLIKVNGVGPKLALTLLSGMAVSDFVRCVQNNDVAALVNMPGVGKKTAERLLVEMRDKLKDLTLQIGATGIELATSAVAPTEAAIDYRYEAETALVSLGYKPQHAARAIAQVVKREDENGSDIDSSETLIRLALKSLA